MDKKIYLACPYTHKDKRIREMRFRLVTTKFAQLISNGYIVFSPITHTHPLAKYENVLHTWDYWKKSDTAFIEWADELWVYMLDGWAESVGVTDEVAIAISMNKPIKYIGEDK